MARRAAATLSYDAARQDRRTEGWKSWGASSADSEIAPAMGVLRGRARDLVRSNPYAARALEVKTANTIGSGIIAEVSNRRLRRLWEPFVEECDAEGALDFYGLQALTERTRSEAGEAIIRFIPADSGKAVPVQLRVLEPDYIDSARTGKEGENQVSNGIEFDRYGRPVAYWLFDDHPGGSGFRSIQSNRVPAEEVIHVFRKLRAGQTRGVTEFAAVMLRLRDLDDYDDAEMMRKKIEACLAAFITTPHKGPASGIGPIKTDPDGRRVESMWPGMVGRLEPGEAVLFSDPKSSGGYADFQRFGQRAIAAGYGVPYELMTGDLSTVNYSSYRAGLVDFRLRVATDQSFVHVPQVCRRVMREFQEEASIVTGQSSAGSRSRVKWTPPRFELLDPLKETEAEVEAVLSGLELWEEVVRRRGGSAEEQLERIAEWQKRLRERGIVLKSNAENPGGTAPSSATPPSSGTPAPPDDGEGGENAAAA